MITVLLFFASTQFNYAQTKPEPELSKAICQEPIEVVNDGKAPGMIGKLIKMDLLADKDHIKEELPIVRNNKL